MKLELNRIYHADALEIYGDNAKLNFPHLRGNEK
jgi:hypothetical protein